jgi:hypothetical protein
MTFSTLYFLCYQVLVNILIKLVHGDGFGAYYKAAIVSWYLAVWLVLSKEGWMNNRASLIPLLTSAKGK